MQCFWLPIIWFLTGVNPSICMYWCGYSPFPLQNRSFLLIYFQVQWFLSHLHSAVKLIQWIFHFKFSIFPSSKISIWFIFSIFYSSSEIFHFYSLLTYLNTVIILALKSSSVIFSLSHLLICFIIFSLIYSSYFSVSLYAMQLSPTWLG